MVNGGLLVLHALVHVVCNCCEKGQDHTQTEKAPETKYQIKTK